MGIGNKITRVGNVERASAAAAAERWERRRVKGIKRMNVVVVTRSDEG